MIAVTFHFLTAADFWIGVGVLAATYGIFALGLQLNVGTTGITNFGQAGFMAIGAYTMAILVVKEGWSWWWAMPAAIAASMLAAIIVGLPSLRLRADYFAITTLAFAEIVRYLADNERDLTEGSQGLLGYNGDWFKLSLRLGSWLNGHGIHVTSFLFPLLLVSWGLLLVLTLLVALVVRTPWGRVLRAIREDEDAARALGKNTLAYKLQSLALAAALAAIAGLRARAEPDAARSRRVRPRVHDLRLRDRDPRRPRQLLRRDPRLGDPDDGARGHALRRAAALGGQGGGDPLHHRRARAHPADGVPAAGASSATSRRCCSVSDGGAILEVDGVEKRYGGVRAVDGASLSVERGSITALIGPNGAGKSTLFDVVSGFERADGGAIRLDGRSIYRLPAFAIARRGLVRTFQMTKTLNVMTVLDNMLLAAPDHPGERLSTLGRAAVGRTPARARRARRARSTCSRRSSLRRRRARTRERSRAASASCSSSRAL